MTWSGIQTKAHSQLDMDLPLLRSTLQASSNTFIQSVEIYWVYSGSYALCRVMRGHKLNIGVHKKYEKTQWWLFLPEPESKWYPGRFHRGSVRWASKHRFSSDRRANTGEVEKDWHRQKLLPWISHPVSHTSKITTQLGLPRTIQAYFYPDRIINFVLYSQSASFEQ